MLPMTKSNNIKIINRFLTAFGMTLRVCKKGVRRAMALPSHALPQLYALKQTVISTEGRNLTVVRQFIINLTL